MESDSRIPQKVADLAKALQRIADNAGFEKWPKPFMALLASRRTELERSGQFANPVLNDWFGHSGAIAETHYLQTTEDDFGVAVGSVGPLVGPTEGNPEPPREVGKRKNPGDSRVEMASDGLRNISEYTRKDSNLQPSVPKTDALSNCATDA
jgi:hypothetical protein